MLYIVSSMNKKKIEEKVRKIHVQIWNQRKSLWPFQMAHPVQMLDPEYGAKVLSIGYEVHESLGNFGYRGARFEIAGLIDRQSNRIAVSRSFPLQTIRFTGAHEIGHWLLHPDRVMHRDRPVNGLAHAKYSREPEEREADYFAACYLMPKKLVIDALETTFRTDEPLIIDDTSAFWLCPSDPDSLLRVDRDSLTCARAVASAESYNSRHFNSLAMQFQVSVTSMAIRLKELNLIRQ